MGKGEVSLSLYPAALQGHPFVGEKEEVDLAPVGLAGSNGYQAGEPWCTLLEPKVAQFGP